MRVLPLLLAAAALFRAPEADACSVGYDESLAPTFTDGAHLPANIPALPVATIDKGPVDYGAPDPSSFQLIGADGGTVGISVTADPSLSETWLVEPGSALSAGDRYELVFPQHRDGGMVASRSFIAGPSQPLPAVAGTVSARTEHRQHDVYTGSASCSEQTEAQVALLSLAPSADLIPHLPAVRWRVEVDGKPWAESRYGDVLADGGVQVPWSTTFLKQRRIDVIHAACDQNVGAQLQGVSPGTHRVTVHAEVAGGGATLTPMETKIDLQCPTTAGGCASAGGGFPAGAALLGGLLLLSALRRR